MVLAKHYIQACMEPLLQLLMINENLQWRAVWKCARKSHEYGYNVQEEDLAIFGQHHAHSSAALENHESQTIVQFTEYDPKSAHNDGNIWQIEPESKCVNCNCTKYDVSAVRWTNFSFKSVMSSPRNNRLSNCHERND